MKKNILINLLIILCVFSTFYTDNTEAGQNAMRADFGLSFLIGGLIMAALSTSIGVYSQIQGAEQAKRASEIQAASLEAQAKQLEQNQLQDSMAARREHTRRIAAAENAYAASGVSLEGTPTLTMAQFSEEMELDVISAEAATEQKRQFMFFDAQNVRKGGQSAYNLGLLGAVGTGLQGASNMAGFGYEINQYKGS